MSDTPRTNNFDWSFHLLFAEAQQMERELKAANERIKRLEEAGDAMHYELTLVDGIPTPASMFWNKAKEAKP